MVAIALRSEPAGLPAQARRILGSHAWLIAVFAAYAGIALATAHALGLERGFSLTLYAEGVLRIYLLWAIALAIGYPAYVIVFVRPRQLTRYLLNALWTRYLTFERLFSASIVLLMLPFFVSVFTSFKTLIPWINPYDWDPTFMAWDRWLHGGSHPWELLQPLLGYPLVTTLVNAVYHLWFFLLFGMLLWQIFSVSQPRLRMQFLLTFALSWSLLGSLAATLLASVGPCYYGAVTGLEDPFAPLMAYLKAADESYPVWALGVQDMLWQAYEARRLEVGAGISAMPSMHVSSSLLLTLLCWRVNRVLGYALGLFTLMILIGSVHLGWHYAIDGYLAIAATLVIWQLVGRFLHSERFGRFFAQSA